MKTPVAVTLIIAGALILITPALSDYLYQRNIAALLAHGFNSVNLDGKMGDLYRIGCWMAGGIMITFAAGLSLLPTGEPARQQSPATHTA